jgi:hypothetical protein
VAEKLRAIAIAELNAAQCRSCPGKWRHLKYFPYEARPDMRIYQFDRSRGVTGFPEHPGDVLKTKE